MRHLLRKASARLSRSGPGRLASSAASTLRGVYYLGFRYLCPLCGWRFRRFSPPGPKSRSNAACPRCGSLERHRSLWLFLERTLGYPSSARGRLLHIAPERALMRRLGRIGDLEYVTFDRSSPLATVRGDVCELPFEAGAFDGVLCSHVLEHVVDDARAMREIHRVLRPGAWAMLQVPWDPARESTYEDASIMSPEERQRHFGRFDHVRIYGRDYVARLQAAGFIVQAQRTGAIFSPEDCTRHALLPSEYLFFCRIPTQAPI